jgi:hypothetical protein
MSKVHWQLASFLVAIMAIGVWSDSVADPVLYTWPVQPKEGRCHTSNKTCTPKTGFYNATTAARDQTAAQHNTRVAFIHRALPLVLSGPCLSFDNAQTTLDRLLWQCEPAHKPTPQTQCPCLHMSEPSQDGVALTYRADHHLAVHPTTNQLAPRQALPHRQHMWRKVDPWGDFSTHIISMTHATLCARALQRCVNLYISFLPCVHIISGEPAARNCLGHTLLRCMQPCTPTAGPSTQISLLLLFLTYTYEGVAISAALRFLIASV